MVLEVPNMGSRRMQFSCLVPPGIVEVTSDGSGLEGSTVNRLKHVETHDTIRFWGDETNINVNFAEHQLTIFPFFSSPWGE